VTTSSLLDQLTGAGVSVRSSAAALVRVDWNEGSPPGSDEVSRRRGHGRHDHHHAASNAGRSGEKLPLLDDHAEDAEAAIEETLPDRHRPRRRRKQLQANGLARFERSWFDLLTKIGIQLNSAGPVDDASRPPKD